MSLGAGLVNRIYAAAFRFYRTRRQVLACERLPFSSAALIIDLGGYSFFWRNWGLGARIYTLNIDRVGGGRAGNTSQIIGDARRAPFCDACFDICFSNSTVEHLGSYEDQVAFAREVRRLAPSYWVQTPNRRFFFETHFLCPFWHWLPNSRVKLFLLRYLSIWGLANRASFAEVEQKLYELNLLSERELRKLFPDATIIKERFLFMTKSLVALRDVRSSE